MFRQRVLAGFLPALLVLFAGGLAYRGAEHTVAAYQAVERTYALEDAVRRVGDQVRDAESGQRGYLLTGRESYLAPYHLATSGTTTAMSQLRTAAAAYPAYTPRIDTLGYFVGLKLAELGETVRLRADQGAAAAADVVRNDRGEEAMRQIRRILNSLDQDISHAAAREEAAALWERRLIGAVILAAVGVAALLALFTNAVYVRQTREQQRTRDELETQSQELQLQAAELEMANAELAAASRELSERTSEAELHQVRLEGVLASAMDAVIAFDDDRHVVYANAAADQLLNLPPAAVIGRDVRDFVPAGRREELEEVLHAARQPASRRAVLDLWDGIVVATGGAELPVEVSVSYARTGKLSLYTAVLRDVSRQRQLEEQFRQAQKMEAVGRLAGGIAHDFNNLLTVIGASSDFLLQDIGSDTGELVRDLEEIRRATNRAAGLTRQLLAFSRRQLVQPQLLDLNLVVADMQTMLRRLIGEDIVLDTVASEQPGMIRIDRGQLEQIVLNLVVNARDAMPGGGRIRVATSEAPAAASEMLAASDEPVAGYVVLTVADSGVGMDEATRERIFEPFFTTKEQGKGTGLGLATVYGIVKQYGGDIIVESERGRGSEFRLYFPRATETAPVEVPEPLPADSLRGDEMVLVVEDEEPLRRLARRILESRGYRVLDAGNGVDAIRVLAQSQDRVDLIVTDVVMPGMGGRELVERILPVYPWIRVLFMSGYTEDTILAHRVAQSGITVLEKPFTPDTLAREVRRALDRPARVPHAPSYAPSA